MNTSEKPAIISEIEITPGLRIDSHIQTHSRLRLLLYSLVLAMMLLIGFTAALNWWQWLLWLISGLLAWLGASGHRLPILQLTQPPLTRNAHHDWQLLIGTAHGAQLWRGELHTIKDYAAVVVLRFHITHPRHRWLNQAIYRDQVNERTWQQLKVMAQLLR